MKMNKIVMVWMLLIMIIASGYSWEFVRNLYGVVDDGRDVAVCADGGLFITGRSNGWALGGSESNPYDYDVFLIKLEPETGEATMIEHYGQNGTGYYDAGWGMCATPDSGCIIAGKTQSPRWSSSGYDDVLIVRVDKNGDSLWTKHYGGYYFDRAWKILAIPGTSDFYVLGPTHSFGPDMPDPDHENIWVMRIDSVGNMKYQGFWADSTRGGHTDARWGCLAPDGGLVVVGDTDDHDTLYPGATDSVRICKAVVAKFDTACNLVWGRVYDRHYFHYSRSIVPHPDGGYIMSTYDKNPSWTWVLRIRDEDGDTLWTKYVGTYIDSTADTLARYANFTMVTPGPDSGFYFSGSGGGKAWILHTDKNCDEIWSVSYEYGAYTENFLSCIMTPDSGCFAAGQTYSRYPYGYSDIYAARVDRYGNDYVGVLEPSSKKPDALDISAYPNPFNGVCRIAVAAGASVKIYDINGKLIQSHIGTFIWQPDKSIGSGVYLVVSNVNGQISEKKITLIR